MVNPLPAKGLKRAQLEYYYDKRAKLIAELDNHKEPEYPWSLHTQIEILNEQIDALMYTQNRRE